MRVVVDIAARVFKSVALVQLTYRSGMQAQTKVLVSEAYKSGLIVLSCGSRGNVLRFLPALTTSDDLINERLAILANSFARVVANS